MFRDEKNLKDSSSASLPDTDMAIKDGLFPVSYNKGDKLITALYMVTDIMDKGEPLRNKLRTLGTDIVSDIHLLSVGQTGVHQKVRTTVSEIMSFLGIARNLNLVSGMNYDILEKEFHALDRSIQESTNETAGMRAPVDLAEFFRKELEAPKSAVYSSLPARLGVQKGGTLMKALRGVEMPARPTSMSDRGSASGVSAHGSQNSIGHRSASESILLKEQRRKDILNIIKINGGNATIKDIKDKAANMSDKNNALVSIGEKTLQRELISMTEDGVLYKEGAKRWSRYFVKI